MTDNVWERDRSHGAAPGDTGAARTLEIRTNADAGRITESGLPTGEILHELSNALASARATIAGFLELVALEARRASIALVWMVAGSLLAVIFLAAAWLSLMVAGAMWAVSLGFPPIAAAVAVAAINLLAGAGLIHACIGRSRDLLFPATRRQAEGQFAAEPRLP